MEKSELNARLIAERVRMAKKKGRWQEYDVCILERMIRTSKQRKSVW